MQTHFLSVPVAFGRKSRVWYATQPIDRALVFVHGFGGDALKTWQQFPQILPSEPSGIFGTGFRPFANSRYPCEYTHTQSALSNQ